MEGFMKGDVVVVPFPFSDLSHAKRRPALVVSPLSKGDVILCQITSQTVLDEYSISLGEEAFAEGSLRKPSNVRPNRLFTAASSLIVSHVGRLSSPAMDQVIDTIVRIIKS